MMTCCGCASRFDIDTPAGIIIKTVSAAISQRSGRPVPQEDYFPDGSVEKFLCSSCLLEKQEIATLLGFYGTGFDFPSEVQSNEPVNMYCLPTTNL